jgi:hypothetical protein
MKARQEKHDGMGSRPPLQRLIQGDAVNRRHPQVTYDQAEGFMGELSERRLAAPNAGYLVALSCEGQLDHFAHIWVVVDDQDPGSRSS